jgi:hypothetical protein
MSSAETTPDPEGGADLEKVLVELSPDHWSGNTAERVWAKPLGSGEYEVRNSPWYAKGISFRDVVFCSGLSEADLPIVREVVRRSGHLTYRVFFPETTPAADRRAALDAINAVGGSWEQGLGQLYSIDVAPDLDAVRVVDLLAVLEDQGTLSWESGD